MWDRRAKFLYNNDGDSAKMLLDQGFGDTKLIDVRLLGVYAPELSQPGGSECKDFVELWFNTHNPGFLYWGFVVTTARMKRSDKEQSTFGRYVGTVTSLSGTDNLNLEIMDFIQKNNYGGGTGG